MHFSSNNDLNQIVIALTEIHLAQATSNFEFACTMATEALGKLRALPCQDDPEQMHEMCSLMVALMAARGNSACALGQMHDALEEFAGMSARARKFGLDLGPTLLQLDDELEQTLAHMEEVNQSFANSQDRLVQSQLRQVDRTMKNLARAV